MTKWHFLTGDVNWSTYSGSWYRHISGRQYHVIELINLIDAMGDDAECTYDVSLKLIDLDTVPEKELDDALSSMGLDDETFARVFEGDDADIGFVEALASYGLFAPMGEWGGNNRRILMRQAKSESGRLANDSNYLQSQLARPVNRLGSTALEFSTGDMDSALIRGIEAGDKIARIMGKMKGFSTELMDEIANTKD